MMNLTMNQGLRTACLFCLLGAFLLPAHSSFAKKHKKQKKVENQTETKVEEGGQQPAEPAEPKEPENPSLKKAISHFEKGVGFFDEGNYSAALAEFLKSYELVPNWALLYNIGTCYSETGRVVEALGELKKYLDQGGSEIPADRRKEVEDTIAKLEGKVGYLAIVCNEAGATVKLDKFKEYTTPVGDPIALLSGFHTISVKKAGFELFEDEFSIASGEDKVMKVTLAELKKGSKSYAEEETKGPVTGDKPTQPKKKKPMRWLWAGLGAGLALGAGAAVTGGMAYKTKNDMLDAADGCTSTMTRDDCPDAYDLQDRTKALQIATDVLWASAVGLTVVGLILFAVDKPRPVEEKKEKPKEKGPGGKGVASVSFAPYGSPAGLPAFGVQALVSFY